MLDRLSPREVDVLVVGYGPVGAALTGLLGGYGARTLVVDDVLTTGLSVIETVEVVRRFGGQVVGAGVLIDRAPAPIDVDFPIYAAYKVQAESYAPDAIPAGSPRFPRASRGAER